MISDSNLRKHFSEFGFMRYLYDRNSSMKSEQNLTGRNKIVMKKIVQITSANARTEVEVVKLETTKVPNMRHLKNEEVNI